MALTTQPSDENGKESDAAAPVHIGGLPPRQPEKLLLADDEHLVASGIAGSLQELGYTVIGPASNGTEAIELCRSHRPHMALLDIRMGQPDGLDVARVLFEVMAVPVIIFSAYSDDNYVERGACTGVFSYLLKPLPKEQLHAAISVAWGRYQDWYDHQSEVRRLRTRLEDRKIIEQAKWLIVQHRGVTEPQAMKIIQTQARNTRRPLVEVARDVVETQSLLNS